MESSASTPSFLFQCKFQNVPLLFFDVLVQQRFVLLEVADPHGNSVTMTSGVSDQISCRKDAGRENLAGTLIRPQRQNMVRAVAGVEDGCDARIEETCQRRQPFLAIGRP